MAEAPPRPGSGAALDVGRLRIPYEKLVLPNGLTVLVHEDHSVPIVAVNLWYHVGSGNEKRGRTGLAHLFEHFFFNGSEHYPHGFREAMDDLGSNNRNGTTNADRTNFFEDVPVSALERTLYLEADRMGFLGGNLSGEMLERERGVVMNEKRQGENQPYGKVANRIAETIYPPSHPYSWPTIGEMDDLRSATLEDVLAWYRTYYTPNNCVLALAGDLTPARAGEMAAGYFGSIPPGPPLPRHQVWVPRLDRGVRDAMEERAPQARIYRVWHAPPWNDPDLIDLDLTAGVLAGGRGSRLVRRLVYEKELATSVAASVSGREIAGTFGLVVTVRPGADPAEAERAMDDVLAEYLRDGPAPDELARARMRIASDFARGIERLGGFGGRSDVLAESMTLAGDPEAYLSQLRRMAEADPRCVGETARRWLEAHHYTMVVTPMPALKSAGAGALERETLPELGRPPEARFPEVQRAVLPNGMRLLLMERHTAPLANVTLVVDAGAAADPAGAPGTASLTLGLMPEGTRTRDAFAIAGELDALGAWIAADNSLDLSAVRLRSLSGSLPGALDLFADVILHASFPEQMVRLGVRRQLARIAQEKSQPVSIALRLASRLLFGEGHPYAAPLTGTGDERSVGRLGREDLAAWHRTWFQPGNATLIAAGDLTMAALEREAGRVFGWSGAAAPGKHVADVAGPAGGTVFLVDRPDAPQSVIVAAHLSERGGRPEDLAMEMLMHLLGGMATSRLNSNLRHEKHWSYGVSAMLMDARGQRPFLVVAPVQTDRTAESMAEIQREVRGIAGERPVRGEELEKIRRNMISRLPGRYETLASLEAAAEEMVAYGYPPEHFQHTARRLREIGEQDLASAALRYVLPHRLIWIVVGDQARIESGLGKLGYGEVVRLDPDGRPLPG